MAKRITKQPPHSKLDAEATVPAGEPPPHDFTSRKPPKIEDTAPYEWLAAYDEIKEPVLVHDKQFRLLRCNAAYAARAGQPMEAIIGKPYWQVFPKVAGPLANGTEVQDTISTESGLAGGAEFTTETGEVFLTREITAHRASGEFWYCQHLMEDVTARKREEASGKLKASFSDAIIGSAPGIFVVVDRQGKFVRWNAGLNLLTGCSDAELHEASALSFVPEGDRERIAANLEEAFVNGHSQGEIRLRSHDLSLRDYAFSAQCFDVDGVPYVASFSLDNTEIIRLDNELVREKAIYNTIIESAPGPFFMLDEQLKLVKWNKNVNRQTGLSDEQLLGHSMVSFIDEEDQPLAAAKFLTAFATGYAQMVVRVPTATHGIRYSSKTAQRFTVDGVPYVAGFCIDVTDRKQAEDALDREKAFSDALIESAPGTFFVVNREGNYVRWNSYLNQLTGLSDRELKRQSVLLTIQEEDRPLAAAMMRDAFENCYAQADLHILTHDQGVRLYSMIARRFKVDEVAYLVGVGVDATDKVATLKQLEQSTRIDPLTKLASRSYFMELAQNEFARCRRYGNMFSVLMVDLDKFKAVNDTYGHAAGDMVLQSLVMTSREALRDWDILGRLGGEEFAVLLPETDANRALLVAERFRQTVASHSVPIGDGKAVHVSISIGVATMREDDATQEMLLARADQALYEAKRTGRDKVCVAERLLARDGGRRKDSFVNE